MLNFISLYYKITKFALRNTNITLYMNAEEFLVKIGEKIRVLRTEKGYSQESLADLVGLSTSGIAKIERGESDITLKKIEKIIKHFDIEVDEFINFAGSSYYNFRNKNGISGVNINNNTLNLSVSKEKFDLLQSQVSLLIQEIETLKSKIGK
jgi:transcriptional regulator with XRE-family HTH domain